MPPFAAPSASPYIRRACSIARGVVLALSCLGGATAAAAEPEAAWPRFRGPNGAGHVADARLPAAWQESDLRWKVALPGGGHSSPVVWGDRVFVTLGDEATGLRRLAAYSLDSGAALWSRELAAPPYKKHAANSVATSTPAVDADALYSAWGTPEQVVLLAHSHAGEPRWEADLGPFHGNHGFGASPIVAGDLVVLNLCQERGGELVALDRATGAVRWRIARRAKNATYSTPCEFTDAAGRRLLIFTDWQHGVMAVDPAAGQVAWELSVFDTERQERAIASPVVAGDLILATSGFVTAQKHFVAVRPPAEPDAAPQEVWRIERAVSYLPSPLVIGERVFLCSEQGIATWLEAATGRIIWQQRIAGAYYASPVAAGPHIYCVSRTGEVTTLSASDTFAELGRSSLGDATHSTPAIAAGRLVFRTEGQLLCVAGE